MLLLVALHLVAAACAPALTRLLDRRAFLVLALVPGASLVWLLAHTGRVTGPDARTLEQTTSWIPALRLELAFSLSTLTWVLAVLVTGVGALVLAYCTWYFREGDPEIWRFSAVLTAFAGSMLGLVLAEDFLLLFVFWELTTVFSYLLVGHNPERRANRRAAMTALIVTTFGGLAMLVGIVVLGERVGSYDISTIVEAAPTGTAVTVAVALVLVGAVSKSALVPFHFWLPGAMAAPTPVSAYLHAAAMVKAGVFLIALLAPAFADDVLWRPSLLALGVLTMIVGGLRALRQHDVKLLLAYGTVSQLGFLVAIVGLGTRAAALAGAAMLVAHALFKAALFMVVGVVDRTCGTRDLRELTGLARRMPVLLVVTVLAAASMAGLPPLAGFVAKETVFAAFEAVATDGDGTGVPGWAGWLVVVGVTLGSVLTVAYSARFVWGVFADKPGVSLPDEPALAPAGFWLPAAVLAAAGLVVGFLGAPETTLLQGYVRELPAGGTEEYLAIWHGFGLPLLLSVVAVVGGVLLHVQRYRVEVLQAQVHVPDTERGYQLVMRGVDRASVEVTGATQRGSLPVYLGTIALVLVLVPGSAVLRAGAWPSDVVPWQLPAQAVAGVVMAAAAVMAVKSRKRLKAVIMAGVAGYGMAVLFILQGAPDLALTQVLVETVTLVVVILVLRRLPAYFSDRPLTRGRWWRVTIGALSGLAVASFALVTAGARTLDPISDAFPREAYDFGGGENIVNVTLVDIRAWDTMGELSVLVVAATGVASLIFLITGRTGRVRPDRAIEDRPSRWLRAGRTIPRENRSAVFEIVTRIAFPMIMVFSLFLVFSGHNEPGGGFAGGLIAGLALMVRYLAGGRHELDEAAPVDAGHLLGVGLVVSTIAALVPLAFGGEVLQSAIVDADLPLLGYVKLVTSLFFDFGVYLVVVGLMLDVLRSLGGGIDRDDEGDPASLRTEEGVR